MSLKDLIDKLAAERKAAEDLIAAADGRGDGLSGEERAAVKGHVEAGEKWRAAIIEAKADQSLADTIAKLGADLGLGDDGSSGGSKRPPVPGGAGKTPADAYLASGEFKTLMGRFPGGRVPDGVHLDSAPVVVPDGFRAYRKALITGADQTGAGAMVRPDWQGLLDTLSRPPLVIGDLIATDTTTSDMIEYVRQTSRVNAAAMVQEATQTSGTSGTKPEGGFRLEIVKAPVEEIAEWIPATRRAIADFGQLRGMIDRELIDDLAQKEEQQFLYGTGASGQLLGISNTPGVLVQDYDTDVLVTARRALTKVRYVGFAEPTAYVLSPEDDEDIDLLRDTMGRFFGNGPFGLGPNTLWGRPRLVSTAVPKGTAWLADWRWATAWDRGDDNISLSDSHADFFVRNLVAVRASERLAFGVVRPPAFCEITLAAA